MAAPDTTSTMQPSSSLNVVQLQLHPELLMAAKRGHWRRLDDLMSKEEEGALVPQVTIDIEIEEADDDEHNGPDSVLHVVASGGDGEEFLMSASVVYGRAKHLLGACNAKGDTPLHCAARAGSIEMVSHLIELARREEDGAERVQVALRKQNKKGETVLHEAIRWADKEMVKVLMSADTELARFPRTNGASPLYMAILLGHNGIAEQLYQKDNQLSYSGPDGQNALHVAVQRSERMTKKLLKWNNNLIKQGNPSSGITPLHFAASWEQIDTWRRAKLLLDADESLAYQPDNKGSFPIHVAALGNSVAVVRVLLEKCPDCAQLRDAQGRTFLHVAVFKDHYILVWWVVSYLLRRNHLLAKKGASQVRRFAEIMNMQDNQGNTALHLAATARSSWTMYPFIWIKEVQLNLQNNKGKTALDLSQSRRTPGVFYGLDPKIRIHRLLTLAGARFGVHGRGEMEQAPVLDEKKEAEKIKDSATTIGVVSVLIITVSVAAAFQLPGGYSTDGNKAGTPELAKRYSFQAFVAANNLAAFCSAMATISLMYAGVTTVDIGTRVGAFVISIFFLNSSARSLAAAFAFGTYAVLAPAAQAVMLLTWPLTGLLLLDIVWFACAIAADQLVLLNRRGIGACLGCVCSMVAVPLGALWPYVVIAGYMAYLKVHGIH